MADPQVRVIVRSLNGFTERLMKKLTLDITSSLIERTPVDTGWARANWVPSVGLPFSETAGTREEAEAGNINVGRQQSGQAQLLGYTLTKGSIFISNNVPYIVDLEGGSSQKAPSGMVLQSIDSAINSLNVIMK